MNFLKTIWKTLKGLFTKSPISTEKIVSEEEAVLIENGEKGDILTENHETNDNNEKQTIIKQIERQEGVNEILEDAENTKTTGKRKNQKKLYEPHELTAELQRLEEQKATLDLAESKIHIVNYPDTSSFDSRIEKLFSLLIKSKVDNKIELSDYTVPGFDEDFTQLETLLSDKSTIIKHINREKEKKKQRLIYENNIKKELNILDTLISQNKLDDAKLLISRLSKSIQPDYIKGINQLSNATKNLKEKELEIFRKRQTELLRQHQQETERIRIEQERILNQQKIAREKAEAKKKFEEDKKLEKKKKLSALLNKKFNWREFQRVLQENGITSFYHFTDYQNLKSIKDNEGLYSWYYADSNGIIINFPGGDTLSRDLDKRYGLQDYVRVSFCSDHPMQYRLKQRGRNLVLLKVDIEVAYYQNTIFCNINATDSNHMKGTELKDLERIKFLATKRTFVRKEDLDFKYHQAELLIKTWIPIEHLENINNFVQ